VASLGMHQTCLPLSLLSEILAFVFLAIAALIIISRDMVVLYMVYGYSSSRSVTLPHRYGNSHAIWDYTLLPATPQR